MPEARATPDGPQVVAALGTIATSGLADLHPAWEGVVRPFLVAQPDRLRTVTAAAAQMGLVAPWDREPDLAGIDLGRPQITVVVPCHLAERSVETCLDSLADQTLPTTAYEVVLVLNGPADRTAERVAAWRQEHPDLAVRVVEAEAARNAAGARNAGLDVVDTPYVAFVDVDDRVRPRYLAALLSEVGPGVIAAVLEEEHVEGRPETLTLDHILGRQGIAAMGRPVEIEEVDWYLRPTWAKAVDTGSARAVRFDESLPGGEDTIFWFTLYARGGHVLRVARGGIEAAYVYATRAPVARGWDERKSVGPGLTVLEAFAAIEMPRRLEPIRRAHLGHVAHWFAAGYLTRQPAEFGRFRDEIERRGLGDVFPWTQLAGRIASELVLLGGDTAATDAALVAGDRAVDVVSVTAGPMPTPAAFDRCGGQHLAVTGATGSWEELGQVVELVTRLADAAEADGHRYLSVRSVSRDPMPHLLAAILRLRDPRLRWTATTARRDGGTGPLPRLVRPDRVLEILAAGLVEAGYAGSTVPDTIPELTELVIGTLADEVLEPAAAPVADLADDGAGPRISVIVPTYRGEERIGTCLDDLAAQTLPAHLFEIVVVQNGPACGTPEIVRAWCERHPAYTVRLLETDVASAQNARNIALDAPTAEWIAFVDDDDRLQPRYLEALWDAAGPGLVPFGRTAIAGTPEADRIGEEVWLNTVPRRLLGRPATNAELWPAIHPAWGKLVERSVIGDVRFDPELRHGDDTVFWMEVLARTDARLVLTDFREGSAYVWIQRAGSLTRSGGDLWTTQVIHKLDAIAAAEAACRGCQDAADLAACAAVCDFFWTSVTAYLGHHPEDGQRLDAEIGRRGLRRVPWRELHEDRPGLLALLDPADPDAVARLQQAAELAHVVATRPPEQGFEETLATVLTGLVQLPVAAATWPLTGRLAQALLTAMREGELTGRVTALHSDGLGPLEALVAGLLRTARPELPWTAYVGDRGLVAGDGGMRPVLADDVLQILGTALAAQDPAITEVPEEMGGLAELVVAVLATEVRLESDVALDALGDRLLSGGAPESVVDRLRQVARVPQGLLRARRIDRTPTW